jgi:hypothetical protein
MVAGIQSSLGPQFSSCDVREALARSGFAACRRHCVLLTHVRERHLPGPMPFRSIKWRGMIGGGVFGVWRPGALAVFPSRCLVDLYG